MLNDLIRQPFTGFPKESLAFLKSLSNPTNNNKVWFDKNRDKYEVNLKLPMRNLIDDLAIEIKKIDNDIVVNYKSIFRINRDIRFSKDKTPYKNYYSAAFAFDKVKSSEVPQFYFHFSKDEFLFAAGQYSTDKDYAKKIRMSIAENYTGFMKIVSEKNFKKEFGNVQGNSLNKIPNGFENYLLPNKPLLTELIKMKQFYVYKTFDINDVLSAKMKDDIVSCIKTTYEFTKFLHIATK